MCASASTDNPKERQTVTIHISGQVPGEAQNGMLAFEDEWSKDRTPDQVIAIVLIERHGFSQKDGDDSRSVTMKFKHIEPIKDVEDAATARKLLEIAVGDRGGSVAAVQPELPIPTEPEPDLDTPLAGKTAAK